MKTRVEFEHLFCRRPLRSHEVKKVSIGGSGINFHYSGSHWASVFGRFIKTSVQARSLLYLNSKWLTLYLLYFKTKTLTKSERPKMKRYARQKCSLFFCIFCFLFSVVRISLGLWYLFAIPVPPALLLLSRLPSFLSNFILLRPTYFLEKCKEHNTRILHTYINCNLATEKEDRGANWLLVGTASFNQEFAILIWE